MSSTEKLQPWGCDQQGRYPTRSNPRFSHGRWHDCWPGEDPAPERPLWRWWVAAWVGGWAAVALVVACVLYGLPWLAGMVLP